MLSNQDKKYLSRFAAPCLRRENPPFSILKEIEGKKPKPTHEDLDLLRRGMETGNISDDFLKRFFPPAYKGVSENGVFRYYLVVHNNHIMNLPNRYIPEPIIKWCTFYLGEIVKKNGSGYVVETLNSEKIKPSLTHSEYPSLKIVDENDIRIGSPVAVHRYTLVKVLDKNEFGLMKPYFYEFLRTKKA